MDIKAIRKALGLSQEAFSELLGVQRETVSHWERGLHIPLPEIAVRIEALVREKMPEPGLSSWKAMQT